jgi:hypothetical protein
VANTEKKDYQILRRNMTKPMDRIDRIENIVGVGNPDINFCAEGVECWIELKSPKEPKRATTPLFGSNHRLSQDQKNWLLRQRNSSGKGWILIASDVRWLLIDGKYGDELNGMTVVELIRVSTWQMLRGDKDKTKWTKLREILIQK